MVYWPMNMVHIIFFGSLERRQFSDHQLNIARTGGEPCTTFDERRAESKQPFELECMGKNMSRPISESLVSFCQDKQVDSEGI